MPTAGTGLKTYHRVMALFNILRQFTAVVKFFVWHTWFNQKISPFASIDRLCDDPKTIHYFFIKNNWLMKTTEPYMLCLNYSETKNKTYSLPKNITCFFRLENNRIVLNPYTQILHGYQSSKERIYLLKFKRARGFPS